VTTTVDLAALEQTIERALVRGDERGLHVLGYGEITTVVAWPDADGPFACKRLPLFTPERFAAYRPAFDDYLVALGERGVDVLRTDLVHQTREDGWIVAYCIQPVLAPDNLLPQALRDAAAGDDAEPRIRALLGSVVDHIADVVDDQVGIDAQVSNWAVGDNGLVYLDVSTPFLRDADGHDRFDCDTYLESIPAVCRGIARRFVIPGVVQTYHSTRSIVLNLAGHLSKEGLDAWIPLTLELARARLGVDVSPAAARRHYRNDVRLWGFIQRLRRVDRAWQRHVRRRPYPFLLPVRGDRTT
jgi:Family of unknown function (DUF6206)